MPGVFQDQGECETQVWLEGGCLGLGLVVGVFFYLPLFLKACVGNVVTATSAPFLGKPAGKKVQEEVALLGACCCCLLCWRRNLMLFPQCCSTKTNTKGNSQDVVSTLLIQ